MDVLRERQKKIDAERRNANKTTNSSDPLHDRQQSIDRASRGVPQKQTYTPQPTQKNIVPRYDPLRQAAADAVAEREARVREARMARSYVPQEIEMPGQRAVDLYGPNGFIKGFDSQWAADAWQADRQAEERERKRAERDARAAEWAQKSAKSGNRSGSTSGKYKGVDRDALREAQRNAANELVYGAETIGLTALEKANNALVNTVHPQRTEIKPGFELLMSRGKDDDLERYVREERDRRANKNYYDFMEAQQPGIDALHEAAYHARAKENDASLPARQSTAQAYTALGNAQYKENAEGQSRVNADIGRLQLQIYYAQDRFRQFPTPENKAIVDQYKATLAAVKENGSMTEVSRKASDEAAAILPKLMESWNALEQYGENPTFATQMEVDKYNRRVAKYNQLLGRYQALEKTIEDEYSKSALGLDPGKILGVYDAKNITQTMANYLPQAVDQGVARVLGGIAGSPFGAKGAKLGAGISSAINMYSMTAGAAFDGLMDVLTAQGVPEEEAIRMANAAVEDEAVLSSLIEYGDTMLDFATLGIDGAVKSLLGLGGKKATGGMAKKALKALAKYGINTFGEGVEEWTQEGISIANENRIREGQETSGIGDLAKRSMQVYWNDGIRGKNKENQERMGEAFAGGSTIAALGGGGTIAINSAIQYAANHDSQISNKAASEILENPEKLAELQKMTGVEITPEMSKSEQRKAVKDAVDTAVGMIQRGQIPEDLRAAAADAVAEEQEEAPQEAAETAQETRTEQAEKSAEEKPVEPQRAVGEATAAQETAPQESLRQMDERVREASLPGQVANMAATAKRAFGEETAKLVTQLYDGKTNVDDYYEAFARTYEAGVSGAMQETVPQRYRSILSDEARKAAYEAGQKTAQASLERDRSKAQFATVAGTESDRSNAKFATADGAESGLVMDEYVEQMDQQVAQRINKVAKLLGTRVRMVDAVEGGRANAQINGHEVLVEKNNPNPVQFLLGHEWTHRLQELAPDEYRRFRDALGKTDYVRNLAEIKVAEHGYEYDEALDEAVADEAGRMVTDGKVLDEFIERNRSDRTLLEKVRDAIRTLWKKLTGAEKRQAQTALGKLNAALDAGAKRVQEIERSGTNKNAATEGGETQQTRNSLKSASDLYRTKYDFTKPMTTDEFKEKIADENARASYFPKGLSDEFVKVISRKSLFTATKLYRGIDAYEFDYLAEHGYLKSNGSYNFANQQGQTLSDEDAAYALSYATGFAPKEIADRHYRGDMLPSYLIEFVNNPDLGMTKNNVQESYTTGKIDQKYITRVFEITYDPDTKQDMIRDVSGEKSTHSMLPKMGSALSELAHGAPQFYMDKTTGTILYEVQDASGKETGKYITEKNPDSMLFYDNLKSSDALMKMAESYWGVSGNEADLVPMTVGNDGTLVPDTARYSLKSAQDQDYLAAVKSGDIETAQRMVDEAAKAAMPKSVIRGRDGRLQYVYHGTEADFYTFDPTVQGGVNGTAEGFGIYLSTDPEVTKHYGERQLRMYANVTHPARSDRKTLTARQLKALIKKTCEAEARRLVDEDEYGSAKEAIRDTWISNYVNTYETASMEAAYDEVARSILRLNDSDMEIVQEVMSGMAIRTYDDAMRFYRDMLTPVTGIDGFITEWKHSETGEGSEIILALDSSQLKLADPVTYDENGEVIPLSKRFDTEQKDIRYSFKGSERDAELAELRTQNEQLLERLEYWKGQTKRSDRAAIDPKAVRKTARDLIRSYGSTLEVDEIAEDLQSLYDYISHGGDETGDLHYTEAQRRADDIADRLVESAIEVDDAMYREYEELRKFLRTTKIVITAADRTAMTDFADFRKRNAGRFTVSVGEHSNIDSVFDELSDRFPEFFDTERENGTSDYLERIEDVMSAIYGSRKNEVNPFAADLDDAKAYAANDIMEQFFDVPQVRKTFADRQAEKLAQEKARGQDRVRQVREQKDAQIERIRKKNAEKLQSAIKRVREQRDEQIAKIRQGYADSKQRERDRKADSESRTRLLKIAKRLQNKKLPAVTRELLNQYIGELDTVSKGITGKTLEDLRALEEWYLDQKENNPDFISDPATEKKLSRLHKKHIADLTAQEVAELTEVLLNIENEIATQRKAIDSEMRHDTYVAGTQVMDDVDASKGSNGGFTDSFLLSELLSPAREVRRITGYKEDDPLYILSKELEKGQRDMFDYKRRASDRFAKWVNDKKLTERLAGKKAQGIQITGTSASGPVQVTITPAMRMSLYLHAKNDQNLRHIAGGGITVPDMDLYRKGNVAEAYDRGTTIKLTPSQVRSITAQMTAEERAFADAAHAYFNGMSREEINAVSEKLKGYSIAGVEDYFPITTDTSFSRREFDSLKFDGTIEGMGFLKERIDASNPIMLLDMNSVLTRSIDNHARYVGLAIPVRNFSKVWGVTRSSFNEDGSRNSYEGSVQKSVKKKWGGNASKYIEKMMTDLQSPPNSQNSWGRALSNVRSNYAGAVLELNASVAIKQSASYPTAAAVVGWKPLMRALSDWKKTDIHTIAKYTPLLWYRSQGFSSQELGDMAKRGKSMPKVLNWIQGMDVATTKKLWKAAEYYVRDAQKNLSVGSDEYYRAVADVYNRIIEETQPNYTTMQRPQLLRSDNELVRTLNMFKTQPFQNFNILYDAFGNLDAKRNAWQESASTENRQAYDNAKQSAARAVSSQIVSAFVFATMQFAWDAFLGRTGKYKDDDDEMTLLSWLKGIGFNMVSSGFGMFPFGTEALELGEALTDGILEKLGADPVFNQKWYGVDVSVTETINDATDDAMSAIIKSVAMIQKAASSDGVDTSDWESYGRAMYDVLDDVSKLLGLPVDNIRKLASGITRNAFLATEGKYIGGYDALRLTSDPSKKANDYYDLLYSAYQNDPDAYRKLYQEMIDSGRFEAEKIKGAMETRMKNAQGVSAVTDLESRYLSPDQQKAYDEVSSSVERSAIWRAATDDQRDKAADMLYDIAVGNTNGQKIKERLQGTPVGESDWVLYNLALGIVDQPNDSGNYGTYTKDEKESAIGMLNKSKAVEDALRELVNPKR